MTHSILAKVVAKRTPKLNPHIMRGLAVHYLRDAEKEKYINHYARKTIHGAVPGLEYHGYERCTPEEEYREVTKLRNNRRQYDMARSDMYMIRINATFPDSGKPRPLADKYLYLPSVGPGSLMHIGGSLFHIKSVLTDKVISPGHRSLFVRMLGTKKNFYRSGYSIRADGQVKPTFVTHSLIYDARKASLPPTTKAMSTMVHYLLQAYGFTETFRKYLGHVPVVGYEDEVNEKNYPASDWIIVSTYHTHMKPPGYIDNMYTPSTLQMAVRRDKWDYATIAFVSEFFYVVDHFPQNVTAENLDETSNWLILLGYILIGGQYTIGRVYSQMQEHLASLTDFVDDGAMEKLSERGYLIENFYDFVAMLTVQFPKLLAENDRVGNIYEKYYDVTYHTLRSITYALTRLRYDLQKTSKRFSPVFNNVNNTWVRKLLPGPIFGLSSEGRVVEVVSYPGDNWYFRLTSKVSEQEKVASAGKGGSRRGSKENNFLDVSMIEGGSILFLPKSDPTPVGNINPYVNINLATGSIIPNPEFVDVLARTRDLLDNK